MPCPSVQLLTHVGLQHWSQPSLLLPHLLSFLKKKSITLPNLFLPCPPLPFSQNAALRPTFLKPWDYRRELKVSFSSFFFSSCPFVPQVIVPQHGSPAGARRDGRELTAEVETIPLRSSIPFPFNHYSWLTNTKTSQTYFLMPKASGYCSVWQLVALFRFNSLAIGKLAAISLWLVPRGYLNTGKY